MATIHRFYLPDSRFAPGVKIELPRDEARHALRVLRLKPGDRIVVFDGRGEARWATLCDIAGKAATAELGDIAEAAEESPLDAALAFAPCKGAKSDLIVQKAVELGARRLIAVRTQRGVVKLDEARAASRREHWRGVAVEACKQCERAFVPEVAGPVDMTDMANAAGERVPLLLAERENCAPLPEAIRASDARERGVCLIAGPEGGWTDEEIELAQSLGWRLASLGPRILRAETACITALAIAQATVGDLAG